jgi:preprotein translocase subunit SecG
VTDETDGIVEVPAAPEPEPAAPEQAEASLDFRPTPPPAPVTESPIPPAPKRTGLFITVAAIVLILIAFVFAGPTLFAAISKSSGGSSGTTTEAAPSKAKITVTIAFVKALLNGDTLAIKVFLRDDAQKAITEDQWKELAAQDTTSAIAYSDVTWSGDTTAVMTLKAPDTGSGESTGTLTFRYDDTEPLNVVMSADIGQSTEVDTIVLAQAGSGWRVVSISNGSQTTSFDAALIKSMVDTSTAAPTTP